MPNMKNLTSAFSVINLKQSLNKKLKKNHPVVNEKYVHYRRDLDSLG